MGHRTLNPTDVLRHIKKHIGAVVYDIEISDDEMMKVVFAETLPTFSKYFPQVLRCDIIKDHNTEFAGTNVYTIPYVDGLAIIGTNRVYPNNMMHNSMGYTMMGATNPVNAQIFQDRRSTYVTRTNMNFMAPNKLEIFPKLNAGEKVLTEIRTVHPKHMASIPMNMREYFLQLALLDVLESLYPIRKRFENISSPYGNINLFLTQVENAKSERENLLDKFHQNAVFARGVISVTPA